MVGANVYRFVTGAMEFAGKVGLNEPPYNTPRDLISMQPRSDSRGILPFYRLLSRNSVAVIEGKRWQARLMARKWNLLRFGEDVLLFIYTVMLFRSVFVIFVSKRSCEF